MKRCKAKGVVLLEAFLALMLMAIASYGLAAVNSVQFSQLAASRDAILAKNYAELEAQYLRQLGYDEVVDDNYDIDDPGRKPRYPDGKNTDVDRASNARNMTKFLGDTLGAEWRSTATLGESVDDIGGDEDNRIQNVIVSVYKASDGADASPRATVTVPLSTQGGNRVPVGGIIAWPKDSNPSTSSNIWLECNGQTFDTNRFKKLYKVLGSNKVPDFRGMFLRGHGSQSFTQNNGTMDGQTHIGNTSTTYSSGDVGAIQGDSMRQMVSYLGGMQWTAGWEKPWYDNGYGPFYPFSWSTINSWPTLYNRLPYTSEWATSGYGDDWYSALTKWRYSISGDAESGYSLVEEEIHPALLFGKGGSGLAFDSARVWPTANEIRPVNVAVCYYIRAK